MPTATDLVTDLPADFEVFGQAVATSMADLLGGSSGYILSKASATDMDFTWIANDQGDITGVTAGNGISVTSPTGPVPTVAIDTAITVDKTTAQTLTNKTLTSPALTTPTISTLTTNGDLVYGTGSGVLQRLGIGSTSNVLTVAGGVPTWAAAAAGGAYTSIASGSLSGAALDLTSISSSYKDLRLIITNPTYSASITTGVIKVNAISSYASLAMNAENATFNTDAGASYSGVTVHYNTMDAAQVGAQIVVDVINYNDSTAYKTIRGTSYYTSSTGTVINNALLNGFARSTAAINRIQYVLTGGNFSTGTYILYGVN